MTIITISGTPGSGKTTIGKKLAKKLDLKFVYSGEIFRKKAQDYDMTLEEFGKYCEKNPEIDKELDNYQIETLKKDNVIVEGRIAGWLASRNNIPAFKIMLDADIETRAGRIKKRENGDIKQRKKEIMVRQKSEEKRYKKYYGIDLRDTTVYDLIVNSSDKSPDEIVEIILNKM